MNLKTERDIGSTKTPVSTTKKKLWVVLGLILLLLIPPITSLRHYARIITGLPLADSQANAECAVVLTGGSGRVREGIALLSHKRVSKLIVSGVHQHSTLADMFPEILFYPEVNLEDVILERRSSSTAGNAQHSLALVEALHCKSILLVTSDYHMYRAGKTFDFFFPPTVQITPYPVPSSKLYKRPSIWFDTKFWTTVFDEWTKFLFYRVFVF